MDDMVAADSDLVVGRDDAANIVRTESVERKVNESGFRRGRLDRPAAAARLALCLGGFTRDLSDALLTLAGITREAKRVTGGYRIDLS